MHQKLGVVRTLLDRSNKIVTKDTDKLIKKQPSKRHCKVVVILTGSSFNKAKQKMQAPKRKKETKNKKDGPKSCGLAVIPYMEGISERVARVYKSYNITTAMKPHCTFVHPKNKRDPLNTTEVIYCVPCKNCKKAYIGETERKLGSV